MVRNKENKRDREEVSKVDKIDTIMNFIGLKYFCSINIVYSIICIWNYYSIDIY